MGGWAVMQESRLVMIAGITTLCAISLFLLTAVIFSFAVLKTMRARRSGIQVPIGMPVVQISAVAPVAEPQEEQVPPVPVIRKRYNNPVTDFMLNALLKKD
jgi:hypothetical protein